MLFSKTINKKAIAMEQLGLIILMLIVVGVLIYIFIFKGAAPAQETINPILLQQKITSCKVSGQTAEARGVKFNDCDNDNYPDNCDICLGGNDGNDKNLNGIPDSCDQDKTQKGDTFQKICKSRNGKLADTDIQQCVLSGPACESWRPKT